MAVGALPPRIATTAYFVIAEALTNVVKHSEARTGRMLSTYIVEVGAPIATLTG